MKTRDEIIIDFKNIIGQFNNDKEQIISDLKETGMEEEQATELVDMILNSFKEGENIIKKENK